VRVSIVGSGYVGLVSGACFAELGHRVVCVDRDAVRIEALRAGQPPMYEPGLDVLIRANAGLGRLSFETSLEAAATADVVVVAVGTPAGPDGRPDLSQVFAVARSLARVAEGRLVLAIKSTVPVGTGDVIEREILSLAPQLALSVVSNPEFLREGQAISDFMQPDRIVIGAEDEVGFETMRRLYAPLTNCGAPLLAAPRRTSELIKYASNAFLAAKLSFINEMADLCEAVGADISLVSAGMGFDQRVGRAFLQAGPGYGGSCFQKDCQGLLATGADHAVELTVVGAAHAANDRRKAAMSRRVIHALGGAVQGRTVSVLGLSFKAGTDDIREAPALRIIHDLIGAGAVVRAYDPQATAQARGALPGVKLCPSAIKCCEGSDCIVVATEWKEFSKLSPAKLANIVSNRLVVDLRNILDHDALVQSGFVVHGIGRRAQYPRANPDHDPIGMRARRHDRRPALPGEAAHPQPSAAYAT
jgi:UDPglucose 6-dehydrogenase